LALLSRATRGKPFPQIEKLVVAGFSLGGVTFLTKVFINIITDLKLQRMFEKIGKKASKALCCQ
jgi:hypothetical protein